MYSANISSSLWLVFSFFYQFHLRSKNSQSWWSPIYQNFFRVCNFNFISKNSLPNPRSCRFSPIFLIESFYRSFRFYIKICDSFWVNIYFWMCGIFFFVFAYGHLVILFCTLSLQNNVERELTTILNFPIHECGISLHLVRPFIPSSVVCGFWDTDLTHISLDLYRSI